MIDIDDFKFHYIDEPNIIYTAKVDGEYYVVVWDDVCEHFSPGEVDWQIEQGYWILT